MRNRNKTKNVSRREFLAGGAMLGFGLAASSTCASQVAGSAKIAKNEIGQAGNTIYTVCHLCNIHCPIKVKTDNGVAVKIDGNPYSAQNMVPHLPFKTSPIDAAALDGKLCPKGQSGIQLLYDPYRLRKVLKRAGARGENRWVTIPFSQAIDEIVNGGKLFANVKGEENRAVPGLQEIRTVTDAAVAKKMGDDVKKILAEKDAAKKAALVAQFKTDHAAHLSTLIDPEHPDLGPKNNQFVFEAGRQGPGRQAFLDRFLKSSFGTTNAHHAGGSICSASVYQAHSEMSNEFADGKWTNGKKDSAPDAMNSEFILAFGCNYFDGRATTAIASRVTTGIADGSLKVAVADPRLSKMAGKAWKWLPLKPGTDGALAMAMVRWIFDNRKFDARYLANANKAAAKADGEPTAVNAAYLVKLSPEGKPGPFLRGSDLGIAKEKRKGADDKEWEFDSFIVLKDGQPVPFDPNDEVNPVEGDLFVNTVVNSIPVKTSLQLLKEESSAKTVEQWAELCGVSSKHIVEVVAEFTSHGKRAATAEYRGVAAHSNAFHSTMAIWSLNVLIGNIGHKGGISTGGGKWDETGSKPGQPFNLAKLHPQSLTAFGTTITRGGTKYEDSTLFAGYPSKRPWIAIPGGALRHELFPSMADGYPYPVKALFTYKSNTVLASPGGKMILDAILDLKKIPLYLACDTIAGDMSMYADYLFPDTSIWERWGLPAAVPEAVTKMIKIRQPAAAPVPESVMIFGEEMPISVEAICLAIAEKMKLPGYGDNGFAEGRHFKRPEDFYLKSVANIAFGEKPDGSDAVPDADAKEMELFLKSRSHLPASVFHAAKWQAAVTPELWPKMVYLLNRGGRFADFSTAYKGEVLGSAPKGILALYAENVAKSKNSMTGKSFSGTPRWEPPQTLLGKDVDEKGFEFTLISYKDVNHGQTHTIPAYWALAACPDHSLLVSNQDARRLGLKEGNKVRLVSRTSDGSVKRGNNKTAEVVVAVKPTEGLRPGVVALSHHFGHWGSGACDIVINGETVKGDARRSTGTQSNLVVSQDPGVANAISAELVAGNAASFDTKIKLERVQA